MFLLVGLLQYATTTHAEHVLAFSLWQRHGDRFWEDMLVWCGSRLAVVKTCVLYGQCCESLSTFFTHSVLT